MSVDIVVITSFVIESVVRLPRFPIVGETLVADLYNLAPGGKGTNQAVAAARQGKKVGIIGKVGDDIFGDMAYRLYEDEGLNSQWVTKTDEVKTAIGLVYFVPSGENTIGLYRGANSLLTKKDVEKGLLDLLPARIISAQLESPDEAIYAAFSIGKQHNAKIILDPAPARNLDERILQKVSVLTPNETEARILAGLDPADESVSLTEIGTRLLDIGPEAVVITLGSKGSLVMEKGKDPVEIPPYKVDTIDTLGAGDCFAGSLAVGLCEGKSLVESSKWASVAAALSTTGVGGIKPLPMREEVERHFKRKS